MILDYHKCSLHLGNTFGYCFILLFACIFMFLISANKRLNSFIHNRTHTLARVTVKEREHDVVSYHLSSACRTTLFKTIELVSYVQLSDCTLCTHVVRLEVRVIFLDTIV